MPPLGALLCQGEGSMFSFPLAVLSVRRHFCSSQGSQDLLFGKCGGHPLRYREMLGLCFEQRGTKVSLTSESL